MNVYIVYFQPVLLCVYAHWILIVVSDGVNCITKSTRGMVSLCKQYLLMQN